MKLRKKDWSAITDFVYELGILEKTPRSGLWFLGTGEQSVAEHLFRTAVIGYILAKLTPKANVDRVIFLCLMHDLGEARTSDLNYVHQRYGRLAERDAIRDIAATLPFGKEIQDAYNEEQARETLEGKIAKDSDVIEWIATLRQEEEKGNKKAGSWIKGIPKRLKTPSGKKLAAQIIKTHPDDWWFDNKDKWFMTQDQKFRSWKKKKKRARQRINLNEPMGLERDDKFIIFVLA